MDIILYNIGFSILLLVVGYLFGSIPNGVWIGKLFFHKDPRDYGSKNSGGTNSGRVLGKKIGILVIFLDALKVILPLYLAWFIFTKVPFVDGKSLVAPIETKYVDGINNYIIKWPIYWLIPVGSAIGHHFPIFANFKGGKNVACFYGMTIGTSWAFGLIPGLFFLLMLKIKKMVSLASIASSWFSVLLAWIWAILIATGAIRGNMVWLVNYGPCLECNYVFAIVLTINAGLLTLFHKENIKRILSGTERKVSWM